MAVVVRPGAPLKTIVLGENSAVLTLATACSGHRSQRPLVIGPGYEDEREKPQMVWGGLGWSLFVNNFLNLSDPVSSSVKWE